MILLRYYLRRSSPTGILAALALFGFHYMMAFVYRGFILNLEGAPTLLMRVIPKAVQSFLGMDRLAPDSVAGILTLAYQHPFVLIVICALAVTCTVEFLVGQVERLTITHLLARPIARPLLPAYAFATPLVWLAVASTSAILGTILGFTRLGYTLPSATQLLQLGLALFALGFAVAGGSLFFSAIADTRSDAAGWSVSVLLAMYVGNFVAQLWDAARPWARLSLFNHYKPIEILAHKSLPLATWSLFMGVGLGGLVLACVVYARREFRV
ncbi:MAG: ABC transporter permease subunit [Candidatus Sumerlaeaceae bacterium]|jgi:hypothetical protein